MTNPRRPLVLLLLLAALIAPVAVACSRIASPQGWASPAQGDGFILAAHKDELFALEADSLHARWAFPPATKDDRVSKVIALYGTPATLNGVVFIPAYEGTLYAVDAATGELKWAFPTGGQLVGDVAVGENAVYFGSGDNKVYALDPAQGDPLWAKPFKAAKPVWSAPVLAGDNLFVTSLDGNLYVLDAATGVERWRYKTSAGIGSPAVVDEEAGLVYVGGFDSRLRAIDLKTHEQRWEAIADNWFWTRPLLFGGVVYAGALDNNVYAVRNLTGAAAWAQPFSADGPVRAAPVIAGAALIIVDREGLVYALDPATGTPLVEQPLDLGDKVLTDPLVVHDTTSGTDRVLLVTSGGDLVTIDPIGLKAVDRMTLAGN